MAYINKCADVEDHYRTQSYVTPSYSGNGDNWKMAPMGKQVSCVSWLPADVNPNGLREITALVPGRDCR